MCTMYLVFHIILTIVFLLLHENCLGVNVTLTAKFQFYSSFSNQHKLRSFQESSFIIYMVISTLSAKLQRQVPEIKHRRKVYTDMAFFETQDVKFFTVIILRGTLFKSSFLRYRIAKTLAFLVE